MNHVLIVVAMLSAIAVCSAKDEKTNLPLSNQATLVETYSPTEVTIQATGLGKSDKDAIIDLHKSAVNFVLSLGTDPLLSTPASKNQFAGIAEQFFTPENINKYISWEADRVISTVRTKMPNGKDGMKITKAVRINKKILTDDLVAKGIISGREELAQATGMPSIMVIPDAPKGQTPLEVFDSNPNAKHAATVIEGYLTNRGYDVLSPQAIDKVNEMTKMQGEIKGAEEDPGYQLALALGSDIYIVFSGTVAGGKATVQLRAYETTTGRLLGSETGYSQNRPSASEAALVEEGINSSIDKVLQRITNYWQDDMKKGIQYKVIFKSPSGAIDEKIQDKISDLIEQNFAVNKENVMSEKTVDYNVWAKKTDFSKSSKIFRFFRDNLSTVAKISQININKKLIILGVEAVQ